MLKALGIKKLRLLTGNTSKLEGLNQYSKTYGFKIIEQILTGRHAIPENQELLRTTEEGNDNRYQNHAQWHLNGTYPSPKKT